MRLLADENEPDDCDEVDYFDDLFDFEENEFDEVRNLFVCKPLHDNDQKATSGNVKNSFTSMTANNPPIHGNGRDVNNNYGNHFHITINDNTNINNLTNKLRQELNLNVRHPPKKRIPVNQKLILYMVGPNESVSVTIAFSGGSKTTWNFNKSCDKKMIEKNINAKDDEEVVILYIYNDGSRDITRVRKNSDHHIEIFNNQNQVITIKYDGGKTVLSCNYQTEATGRTLSGRSYKVSGEIQTHKLFGDHLKLTTGNCQIVESAAFRQNRSEMLKLCPGLQQVFDLLIEQQKLYTLLD